MLKKISPFLIFFVVIGVLLAPVSASFAPKQNTNISVNSVFAQTPDPVPPPPDTSQSEDAYSKIGSCGITSGSGWAACFINVYMYLIYMPSFVIVSLAGHLFDYFILYSIDSGSYNTTNGFIEKGWTIIRDICNLFFLFILLYIAIRHILGSGGGWTGKALKNLIIIALLINFSLFFTRIMIDAGNVLARVFYSSISVENEDLPLGSKSLSVGFVKKINPQRILTSNIFEPDQTLVQNPNATSQQESPQSTVFLVFLMMTAINVVLAIVFLSVCLLLLARVIGLWFMMIFSPIAFISFAIPGGGGMFGKFNFEKWLKTTSSLAFMAPVLLFFLFLIIMFFDAIFSESATSDNFIEIMIPFLIVIFMLNLAKKTAKEMSGEFGAAVTKAATTAAMAAGVVATAGIGASAFAGRAIGGRIAGSVLRSGWTQGKIANTSEKLAALEGKKGARASLQRLRLRSMKGVYGAAESTANAAHKGTWDPRNTVAGKIGGRGLNLVNNLAGTKIKLGKGGKETRDKYESTLRKNRLDKAERRSNVSQNEKRDYQNRFETDADKKKIIDQKIKAERGRLDSMRNKGEIDENEYRKQLSRLKTPEFRKELIKKEVDKYTKDISKSRREAYAKTVEGDGFLGGKYNPLSKTTQGHRQNIADDIRDSKKSKSDAEKAYDLFEKMRKKEEAEKAGGGGGSSDAGGVASGAPATPPSGGSGGPSSGPTAYGGGLDTDKVVGAINQVRDTISKEGNMERKRDVKDIESMSGISDALKDLDSGQNMSPGGNIRSSGGGFTENRNIAGFGNRGQSTPNQGNGSIGFKQGDNK